MQLFKEKGLVSKARVDMGKPRLMRQEIPMLGKESRVIDELLTTGKGALFQITCVSLGNPHCIIFVDNLDGIDVAKWGKRLNGILCFRKG